jgi:hypothetical protein
MKNVFITYSNFRSFLYEFEPRKKCKTKYRFDECDIDFLSENDISMLEVARDFLANPEELLTHKYVRVERIDDHEFVSTSKNPAYHLKRNCSLLKSNFKAYMIPDVVSLKGYFEIKKYRFWHKVNKPLAWYNFEKFKEKHKVVWGSELRISNIPNSGNMAFLNMTINELEEVVKFKIDEIIKFKSKNPNKWSEIQSNAYSVNPRGSLTPNGAFYSNRELFDFNKKLKNPLISALLHYYRAKLNPDLDFNLEILDQLGFKLCKSCNSKKDSDAEKTSNSTLIQKKKSKNVILSNSDHVKSADNEQSIKSTLTISSSQKQEFYEKVHKDLSEMAENKTPYVIENYINYLYEQVVAECNDTYLGLIYVQLFPRIAATIINENLKIRKYLIDNQIATDDVLDLRDSFEDITNVEKYVDQRVLTPDKTGPLRSEVDQYSSKLEKAYQTDQDIDFKVHLGNFDFDQVYQIDNFHFPPIDYRYWLSRHGDNIVGGTRLGLTSRLSYLKMMNSTISQDVIGLKSMPEAVKFIERKIASETKGEQDYLDIFDAINNWGGKTIQRGKIYSGLTLRNNLEYGNWFANYIMAADLLRQKERVLDGIELMFSIPGLGVSFGSKHIAFWTYDNPVTAVYDSKISQILLRSENPKIKDVIPFFSAIKKLADDQSEYCGNLMPKEIEKALFAFHEYYWLNNGKWLGKTSGNDFGCAVEWNKRMVF